MKSYTVIENKRNGGLILTDKDLDPDSDKPQKFTVINGGWNATYKNGLVHGGTEVFAVELYRNFESEGCYNEVLWNFKKEMLNEKKQDI